VPLVEDIQELVLHLEQEDTLELEPLQVQEAILEQEPLLAQEDILEDNRELLVVVTLEDNQELLVVDILEDNKELLVEDIPGLELLLVNLEVELLLQANLEELQRPKWTPRWPSGSKQWTRITAAILMPQNWARPWPMET